jgi:hypothetical protein
VSGTATAKLGTRVTAPFGRRACEVTRNIATLAAAVIFQPALLATQRQTPPIREEP